MDRKTNMTEDPLDLSVPSQTAKLQLVRQFIAKAARRFGFSPSEAEKIALAVDEACTNIIKHAYDFATDEKIDLRVSMQDGKFEVHITDYGKSFDPGSVTVPDMKEYLKHYQQGGLGMYIMKALMDEVEYHMRPSQHNEVRLVKYLPRVRSES